MNTWYSRDLGDAIYGGDGILHEMVLPHFQQLFLLAGEPPDMAVFTRLESEGRMHCALVVYFSPAAHKAAEALDASSCEKPARPGLDLFAGDLRCWSVLFAVLDEESSGNEGGKIAVVRRAPRSVI